MNLSTFKFSILIILFLLKNVEINCDFINHSPTSTSNNQQQQQQQSFSNVCQSGIREDNTNYIYCARRSLQQVPIFSKNNVVYDELVLSDNRINELRSDSFARIKVKKIYLNGNPIRHIDSKAFVKLQNHLEELWLDADTQQNEFEQVSSLTQTSTTIENGLPIAVVEHLRNLNTLKLKGFNVKVLNNEAFKKLNRIEILSLQFCSIEEIESNAFDALRNSLKELYLDGNMLKYIPTESLLNAQFKSLRILSISQNNIKTISSESFGAFFFKSSFSSLVKLDLSYNGLKHIDSQAFNSFNQTLETLYLQNNELNSFNLKFIRHLSNLNELNLNFNLINKLTASLFVNSAKLQFLSLQGNTIQFDDTFESSTVFNGLDGLQRLNLARNGIKYLPNGLFRPLAQLKSLILDKNNLESLNENTFMGLENSLMNISLQNINMKSSDLQSLRNLRNLERVKLGFNQIEFIDWSIFNSMHAKLSNLDLQNNKIAHIQLYNDLNENGTVNYLMEHLIELDLSTNKLCTFNSNLLTRMPKLKNLALSQNPLYCDCNLLSLYEWTRRKFDKDIIGFIQWQCEMPSISTSSQENKMRRFISLQASDFVCSSAIPSKCQSNQLNNQQTHEQLKQKAITNEPNSMNFLFNSQSSSAQQIQSTQTSQIQQTTRKMKQARISNMQLTNIKNSVLIEWQLDSSDVSVLSEIRGFKINYNLLNKNNSIHIAEESDASIILKDNTERKFKLDNLNTNSRYTICVSILRQQGYDKYCRDIDVNGAGKRQQSQAQQTFTTRIENLKSNSASSLMPTIESNSHTFNNNIISALIISVLIILICFIIGLIIFIYVYMKKCKLNQKKMAMKTLRHDYTGAILTSDQLNHFDTLMKASHLNHHKVSTINNLSPLNEITLANTTANPNFCTCIRLNQTGGQSARHNESSTVSSTLSSNNNNNHPNQQTFDMDRFHNCNEMTTNSSDIHSSSPTSFTHFIPGTSNQLTAAYVPYELCFQANQQPSLIGNANATGTLIIPTMKPNAFLSTLNNNSKKLYEKAKLTQVTVGNAANHYGFLNSNGTETFSNNNNNNKSAQSSNQNDHVYCEIPSTIGRTFQLVYNAPNELINLNSFQLTNEQLQQLHFQQQQQQQQFVTNQQPPSSSRYSQQNSSASLLLSTSSSSSSSSPQPINTNTNFTSASII